MKARISKSIIGGTITAPPSKSYTIRSLFVAATAAGTSRIINPLVSEDTKAAAEVLERLGAVIERQPGVWIITGGQLKPPQQELDCRQSAATLRFLTPLCASLSGPSRITFAPGLARRPMTPLLDILKQLGIAAENRPDYMLINGGRVNTRVVSLPGDISSQFISGLMLAASQFPDGLQIKLTTPARSKDYLRMTMACLRHFSVNADHNDTLTEFTVRQQTPRPTNYEVEGDWSGASYFLGMGALNGPVSICGLNPGSFQADRFMLNCLEQMGATVTIDNDKIMVEPSMLQAVNVDLDEAIDLLPTVACLAAAAKGTSLITGLRRARLKESDRIRALAENLKPMSISVTEETDRLLITGGQPHGAVIDSFEDHRIAMAFAMLSAVCGDSIIEGADCVNKTYPDFWEDFQQVGGKVILSE
ncbi:MAG: 3-phosphoshikimate 1-carboxyvinyltransferase [Dehalogenimonas sp.]